MDLENNNGSESLINKNNLDDHLLESNEQFGLIKG
jgi:hypothetical protein